jgi:glycosyltransferase involved in cell wall biosynthesis
LLHFLTQRFAVHLITFIDEHSPNPEPELPRGLVDSITSIHLPHHDRSAFSRAYRNTGRLLRGQLPLTDRFCQEQSQRRVELAIADKRYAVAVIEHFWCARYVELLRKRAEFVVLNLHNVESVLHEHCARTEPFPHKVGHRFFRRTAQRMERELLAEFDLVLVTSTDDQRRVSEICPRARTAVYPNAIPLHGQPRTPEEHVIAFSGNLEYHPNVSAVRYFREEVWPGLRDADPGLRWRLIGRNEQCVEALVAGDERIERTGAIPDSIDELARAKVIVVPLLAGSGTRIKILEAWAAGRAVVSTSIGAEGLDARDGENIRIADNPKEMKAAVLELLENPSERNRLGMAGRAAMERNYSWPAAWRTMEQAWDEMLCAAGMVTVG